ncbi:hypothetical protein [Mesorhizobium sp.]|uniref:hypothetical protein n=1 Tax=Mesorhizobium sp. TaxID=1871066 RepID=UPI000FE8886E|nr:hypothetical protein [Mesorhizobium sp.]RWB04263.1 MAG: hypothetical protein EOQ33_11925 [Mesorhizobium sp.]
MNANLKTEARRKIILDGYFNNEPLKDIAAKVGCSLASLKVTASKFGCTRLRNMRRNFGEDFMSQNKNCEITANL